MVFEKGTSVKNKLFRERPLISAFEINPTLAKVQEQKLLEMHENEV